ncbi:MAG TPA: R3H domain-containing nucleic acid-binding protein, partial [Candidatus Krumholzibacteria bacterium]|nr:R3H domain-containing nucleic acid-binding protein [Candidatus Krumholzibacteria bacterium]
DRDRDGRDRGERGGRRERRDRNDRNDRNDEARADARGGRPRDERKAAGDEDRSRRRRRRPEGEEASAAQEAAPRRERRERPERPERTERSGRPDRAERPERQETRAADSRPRGGDENGDDADGEARRRRRRRGGRRRRKGGGEGEPAEGNAVQAAAVVEVDGNRLPADDGPEVDGNTITRDDADDFGPQFDEDGNRLPRQRRTRRERRPREERPAAATVERDEPVTKPQPETPLPPTGEPIAVSQTTARVAAASVDQTDATVKELTGELLQRCGFMSSVRLLEKNDDGRLPVRVVVDADSVEAMVGRRSSAITSVQHLVERLNQKATGEFLPLDLDINNYRQRQDGKLTRLTQDAIGRVQQSGDEEHLPPMNARDRRVVHMEVAEVDGLHTYTVGQGMDRRVVICVDKGADNPPSEPDEPRH